MRGRTPRVERLAHEAEQRAQAVAESERLLRSVYEAIGSGVLVFDEQRHGDQCEWAAEEILGRPVDELVGMQSADFQPGIQPRTDRRCPRRIASFRVPFAPRQPLRKIVFGMLRPDGARRWLQVDAVPTGSA